MASKAAKKMRATATPNDRKRVHGELMTTLSGLLQHGSQTTRTSAPTEATAGKKKSTSSPSKGDGGKA